MFIPDLSPALLVLAGSVLTVAIWRDYLYHRIDNWITFTGAFLALVLHLQIAGWSGAVQSVLGMSLGLALLLPFYLKGGMAAGDVKLMAAMGACVGIHSIFWVTLYSLIAGAGMAFALLLVKGEAGSGMAHIFQQFRAYSLTRVWVSAGSIPSKADFTIARRFPYAAAIGGGCLVLALLGPPQGF